MATHRDRTALTMCVHREDVRPVFVSLQNLARSWDTIPLEVLTRSLLIPGIPRRFLFPSCVQDEREAASRALSLSRTPVTVYLKLTIKMLETEGAPACAHSEDSSCEWHTHRASDVGARRPPEFERGALDGCVEPNSHKHPSHRSNVP